MKTKFVVVDQNNEISWSEKKEAGEAFTSYAAADKRARELAGYNPGETIGIYELAGEVTAPVGKIVSHRRP